MTATDDPFAVNLGLTLWTLLVLDPDLARRPWILGMATDGPSAVGSLVNRAWTRSSSFAIFSKLEGSSRRAKERRPGIQTEASR